MSMENTHRYLGSGSAFAGANLERGRFVKKDSEGKLIYTLAGEQCVGAIHQNADQGEELAYVWSGIIEIKVGVGGVSVNSEVTSDATGQAVDLANLDIVGSGIGVTADAANPEFSGGALPSKSLGIALADAAEGEMVQIRLS